MSLLLHKLQAKGLQYWKVIKNLERSQSDCKVRLF